MQKPPKNKVLDTLSVLLEVQEFDMQMIQLMRLKKERQKELDQINKTKDQQSKQAEGKGEEILEIKSAIRLSEGDLQEIQEKLKKLETQQSEVKKVDEFNALSQEMSRTDKERHNKESELSDLYDKLAAEEEALKKIQENLESTIESSKVLEREIHERIVEINKEGRGIKETRDKLVDKVDSHSFGIYERLLRNKKDRVIVPIENRSCSGCHIVLTAQDENLVRKAERFIFCEHCSRILYWVENEEREEAAPRRRRRRSSSAVSS